MSLLRYALLIAVMAANGAQAVELGRRNAVPVLYLQGSHYEVGFDQGRTFSSVIHAFVKRHFEMLPFEQEYATEAGRAAYEKTLANMRQRYPWYVKEIQGIADGAQVPFYKIFLLHCDDIVLTANDEHAPRPDHGGCTSIGINTDDYSILGHNEDAFASTLNHWYIVSAHVTPTDEDRKHGAVGERYSSLCYAGHMPGYTMGFNEHGLVFSINTLSPLRLKPGGTPRVFITRALLTAKNFAEAEKIMRDDGLGAGNGFNINMIWSEPWGARRLYNAEVAPDLNARFSSVSVRKYERDSLAHTNIYQNLNVTEVVGMIVDSSMARLCAIQKHAPPQTRRDVADILSDAEGKTYSVWQNRPDAVVKTIATGIFDLEKRTWSMYIGKANETEPVAVLPIRFTRLNDVN
ncbi:beta-alanyl-dopamine/carcinine hydrolase isoform X3 [Cydia splendana]|uniref:beta-alanyl-dopamine/carcinine hydrolase isoform X3 n=1 Tax=Cydia splendana TaxID=1100963 RepID=UPI00300CD79D